MLWTVSWGYSMKLDWGYDNMIGCAKVVSVSTSCSRCHNLIFFLLVVSYFITLLLHRLLVVSSCTPCIYSIDIFLYSYALPLIHLSYSSSSLCLSCNLSSSLRSLHLVKHWQAHLAREVYMNDTRQSYLLGNETRVV